MLLAETVQGAVRWTPDGGFTGPRPVAALAVAVVENAALPAVGVPIGIPAPDLQRRVETALLRFGGFRITERTDPPAPEPTPFGVVN